MLDGLAASSPSDRLAKALTMLGRAVKSTYLLRYLHDGALRDRVHLQLNRGESRHELAPRLFFIVPSLEARGDVVARADLARVSPLAHAHVIPSGTYRFPRKNAGSAS